MNEKPKEKNNTYLYLVEAGLGDEGNKARSAAIRRVVDKTKIRLGQEYNMERIESILEKPVSDFDMLRIQVSEMTNHQVYLEDGFYDKQDKKYWVLCRVQKTMNNPMDFREETVVDNIVSQPEIVKSEPDKNTESVPNVVENTNDNKDKVVVTPKPTPKPKPSQKKPVPQKKIWWESALVPGLAQMQKNHVAEGVITLVGEAALVGGGIYTHYHSQKQLVFMKDPNTVPSAFQDALKAYKRDMVINLTCYASAAALYVFNLYRAYTLDAYPYYAFSPTVITVGGEVTMGLCFTYNF